MPAVCQGDAESRQRRQYRDREQYARGQASLVIDIRKTSGSSLHWTCAARRQARCSKVHVWRMYDAGPAGENPRLRTNLDAVYSAGDPRRTPHQFGSRPHEPSGAGAAGGRRDADARHDGEIAGVALMVVFRSQLGWRPGSRKCSAATGSATASAASSTPGCPTGCLSLAMIRSLSSWTLGEASSRLSSARRRLSPGAHLRHHGGLVVRRLRSRRRAAPAPRRPIYGSNPRRVEAWAATAWRRMRVSPQKLAVMPASTAAD